MTATGGASPAALDPQLHAAGLQCDLRLWRAARGEERGRGGREVVTDGEREALRAAVMSACPQAQRLEAPGAADAAARTLALLAGRRAVLDAVFEVGGARACVTLIEPLGDGTWRLCDLQPVQRVTEPQRDRAAFLLHLARSSGLECDSVEIWHPDPGRTRAGDQDLAALLRRQDVTADASFLAGDVGAEIARMRAIIEGEEPGTPPSPHCQRPSRCPHRERCTADRPDDWIGFLPRLRPGLWQVLQELGVPDMGAIPDDVRLGREARNARRAIRERGRAIDPRLGAELARARPPLAFLDFEAVSPAVPLLEGTRPFETLPVQWSLHVLDAAGQLSHREHLHADGDDPRPAFAHSLIDALAAVEGPICVYSSFESEVLQALETRLRAHAAGLGAIRARLVDLLELLRQHVYDPGFRGVYTLKRVARVLAPGAPGWEDLEIRDGAAAARAWLELLRGETPPAERAASRRALAAYCAHDTLNTHAIWEVLSGRDQVATRK